jgi:hypothetical protein
MVRFFLWLAKVVETWAKTSMLRGPSSVSYPILEKNILFLKIINYENHWIHEKIQIKQSHIFPWNFVGFSPSMIALGFWPGRSSDFAAGPGWLVVWLWNPKIHEMLIAYAQNHTHRIHVCYIYMETFTINIPQMLAYIPYMDPMGYRQRYPRNSSHKLRYHLVMTNSLPWKITIFYR